MRCRCCDCWIAPGWLIRSVEYGVIIAALVMGAWLASGCSTIHVSTPEGYTASYTRIGDQEISGLRFEKDSTGLTRIVLDKQASKSDVVLSALKALVEGAK